MHDLETIKRINAAPSARYSQTTGEKLSRRSGDPGLLSLVAAYERRRVRNILATSVGSSTERRYDFAADVNEALDEVAHLVRSPQPITLGDL